MLVKLHRPPPDMRIFLPTLLALSSTSTRRPRAPATAAHISPAAPAPMITTSNSRLVWGSAVMGAYSTPSRGGALDVWGSILRSAKHGTGQHGFAYKSAALYASPFRSDEKIQGWSYDIVFGKH